MTCDLSLRNFDDRRVGRAAAKGAFAEVRKLGRLDARVRSTRLRRRGDVAHISMTVSAHSAWEAFDLGRAIIRAGIHGSGGSTAGWELVRPRMMSHRATRRPRGQGRVPPVDLVRTLSWEAATVAARRQAIPATALPPLGSVAVAAGTVIDLR